MSTTLHEILREDTFYCRTNSGYEQTSTAQTTLWGQDLPNDFWVSETHEVSYSYTGKRKIRMVITKHPVGYFHRISRNIKVTSKYWLVPAEMTDADALALAVTKRTDTQCSTEPTLAHIAEFTDLPAWAEGAQMLQ